MQKEVRTWTIKNIILWPATCLLQISPIIAITFITIIIGISSYVYLRINFNFWGLTAINYADYEISSNSKLIQNATKKWALSYETSTEVEFKGEIRHISPIRMGRFQILSHDILVTTGDFTNPELVKTSVVNHKFTWRTAQTGKPNGSINLLHTVPLNQEIYDQLWLLGQGDNVIISGYEILKIELVDKDGAVQSWWEDHGCNTFLVTSIQKISSN